MHWPHRWGLVVSSSTKYWTSSGRHPPLKDEADPSRASARSVGPAHLPSSGIRPFRTVQEVVGVGNELFLTLYQANKRGGGGIHEKSNGMNEIQVNFNSIYLLNRAQNLLDGQLIPCHCIREWQRLLFSNKLSVPERMIGRSTSSEQDLVISQPLKIRSYVFSLCRKSRRGTTIQPLVFQGWERCLKRNDLKQQIRRVKEDDSIGELCHLSLSPKNYEEIEKEAHVLFSLLGRSIHLVVSTWTRKIDSLSESHCFYFKETLPLQYFDGIWNGIIKERNRMG